jgi:hypothetical protein
MSVHWTAARFVKSKKASKAPASVFCHRRKKEVLAKITSTHNKLGVAIFNVVSLRFIYFTEAFPCR